MAKGAQTEQGPEKKVKKFIFSINSKIGPDGQIIDGGKLNGEFSGSTNNLADCLTVVGESSEIIKNGIILAAFSLMEGDVAPHLEKYLEKYLERQFSKLSQLTKSTN